MVIWVLRTAHIRWCKTMKYENYDIRIKNNYFNGLLSLFYGGRLIPESAIESYNIALNTESVDLDTHINHSLSVLKTDILLNGNFYRLEKKMVDVYDTAFYYLVPAKIGRKYSEKHDPLKIELLSLLDSYLILSDVIHADPIPNKVEKQGIYDIDISYNGKLVGLILPMTMDHFVEEVISKKRFTRPLIIATCNAEDAKAYRARLGSFITLKTHQNIKFIELSELVRDPKKIHAILKYITSV